MTEQTLRAASCLCCGTIGTPKVWKIDEPSVYVCERCHRCATLEWKGATTEEEGDAYMHGWFDGNEAPKYGAAPIAAPAGQLPPLTDAMYWAARGVEITVELVSGPSATAMLIHVTDDLLDDIWDAINTALRVSASPTAPDMKKG